VKIGNADINSGETDGTTIGGNSAAAGTFTTIIVPTLDADEVNITDNKIKAATVNADLELGANGTGNVVINGFTFPNTPFAGQLIKTNGNKVLSTVVLPFVVTDSDVQDGTATLTGDSSTQTIDSFSTSTYRSAKYHIQISDTTADRYELVEANVTHDDSNAYISVTGGASNGTGDGSTAYDSIDLTADISGGNVRLRGTVNNTNNQVIKFVKRVIKV